MLGFQCSLAELGVCFLLSRLGRLFTHGDAAAADDDDDDDDDTTVTVSSYPTVNLSTGLRKFLNRIAGCHLQNDAVRNGEI